MAAENKQEATSKAGYWTERVDLMIPRDPSNPKESDVSIIVNGKIFQIKRGDTVKVPRYVYQAYVDSELQKTVAYDQQSHAPNNA